MIRKSQFYFCSGQYEWNNVFTVNCFLCYSGGFSKPLNPLGITKTVFNSFRPWPLRRGNLASKAPR